MTDAAAFERIDADKPGLLLLCDHASRALPSRYGLLGLPESSWQTHIAFDIGAATVTRTLAAAFAAPAILGRWSRLLVDLNRGEDDPTLVMQLSDGAIVAGNRGVDRREIEQRIARYHRPYHDAIAAEIQRQGEAGSVAAVLSIHSFTPAWKGRARPWQVGILWDRDPRLAVPLMAELRAAGFSVGDNEPYSGALENDTLYRHGTMKGLPHALIEIRQDLIGEEDAARAFASRLVPIIAAALAAMGAPAIQFTPTLGSKVHG